MQKLTLAVAALAGSAALVAQSPCAGSAGSTVLRTFDPWAASFYYPANADTTLNQFVDLTVSAPLTVNQMFSTSYDQAAGATAPPDQTGNIAEVRLYTVPTTHVGNEQNQAAWTHVASADMLIVAYSGDCVINNFRDPVTNNPAPFVLPAGTYGFCLEYIPTTYSGTPLAAQNPGALSCIGYDPGTTYAALGSDQFLAMANGGIQGNGWQTVDLSGALQPNATPGVPFADQPNIAFDYTPDPNAAHSQTTGEGCYNLPFMIYELIPENTTPVDVAGTSYTAVLTPSANGGFYTITAGGIPYIAPPIGAPGLVDLTQSGAAATPVANSSGSLDDCTFSYTPSNPISLPAPGGGLMATELGINSNGKIYFDTVAPSATTFQYNGSNYGSLIPFRDEAVQWAVFNTDLDPSTGVGNIYVMEPSPNLGGVMIWWDDVQNWPAVAGVTSSFSIEFDPTGSLVNIAYGPNLSCNGSGDLLIGFSGGNGEPIGTAIDWSAITGNPGVVSGDGSSATVLDVSARPIEGTTIDMVMSNLSVADPNGLPRIGLMLATNNPGPFPLDLGVIGAPSCFYHLDPAGFIALTAIEDIINTPGELRLTLPIPTGLNGAELNWQGVFLWPQLPPNSLGMTVSNALCFRTGTL